METSGRIDSDRVACRGLTELFFSELVVDAERAVEVCETCAVRASCLQVALDRREPHGVWGGRVFRDGVAMVSPPRRGRPAKAA